MVDAQVKILTEVQQKASISKGKAHPLQKKKKRQNARPVLENPFILKFPKIEKDDEENLIKCIKESFTGMKRLRVKKSKIKTVKQQIIDPNVEKFWSEIVLGYNAVMRGIEKDRFTAVLVEKATSPAYLALTFVPACSNNDVNLIPIDGLSSMVKDNTLLGIEHRCLVIGLKKSVEKTDSNLNILYKKICDINYEDEECNDPEMDVDRSNEELIENSKTDGVAEDKLCKETNKEKNTCTEIIANPIFLKRKNSSQRVFIPSLGKLNLLKNDDSTEFLSFGSTENTSDLSKEVKQERSISKPIDMSSINFSSAFVIDTSAAIDDDIKPDTTKPEDKILGTKKSKRKTDENRYFPASMVRMESNPNKKKKAKDFK